MGLGSWLGDKKDAAIQAIALSVLKGKVNSMRKAGSGPIKFLDGNEGLVLAVTFIAAGVFALATGHDITPLIGEFFKAIGWTDAGLIQKAQIIATQVTPLVWALWVAARNFWEWWQQHKAGAKLSELGSTVGVVKQALAEGKVVDARTGAPMADFNASAAATPTTVAPKGPVVIVEPAKV